MGGTGRGEQEGWHSFSSLFGLPVRLTRLERPRVDSVSNPAPSLGETLSDGCQAEIPSFNHSDPSVTKWRFFGHRALSSSANGWGKYDSNPSSHVYWHRFISFIYSSFLSFVLPSCHFLPFLSNCLFTIRRNTTEKTLIFFHAAKGKPTVDLWRRKWWKQKNVIDCINTVILLSWLKRFTEKTIRISWSR